ncbi:hypothetical protein BH18ACI5_BH18ACI5_10220 [soil metagenome]
MLVRASSVAAVIACCAVALTAQVFRAGVELVPLNVSVTDGTKFVGDLEESEFEVFEDGTKQAISFFSRK